MLQKVNPVAGDIVCWPGYKACQAELELQENGTNK